MTTANIITLTRIVLVPVFMYFASRGDALGDIAALCLFALASLTDGVDGYVARRYNQVTNFGKFIDPLADKLLVCAALLVLLERGVLPAWPVMVVLAREFIVTSLRCVAAAEGLVIAAVLSGKIKMLTQVVCIGLLFTGWSDTVVLWQITVSGLCVFALAVTAVFSCYDYLRKNIAVIKDGLEQKGGQRR